MTFMQLEQLKSEKSKMYSEKIALENHLEAEQEFIMNKLQKQVNWIKCVWWKLGACQSLVGSFSTSGMVFSLP